MAQMSLLQLFSFLSLISYALCRPSYGYKSSSYDAPSPSGYGGGGYGGGYGGGGHGPGKSSSGIRQVAWYVNWAIYARQFFVEDLNTQDMSHVMYAFAGVQEEDGTVYLTDPWADYQRPSPTDDTNAAGNNMFGNLKQLYLQKKRNRNIKVMLSVGGWTLSPQMHKPMSTPEGRENMTRTVVDLIQQYGFDGVDYDYEYPRNKAEGEAWTDLMRLTRESLESRRQANNQTSKFWVTAAIPAGPQNYVNLDVAGMSKYTDFFTLMAYDYAGPGFSNHSGHASNLFPSLTNPKSTDFNTQQAVSYYLSNGLPRSSLQLGIPLYGRSFASTLGPGQPFTKPNDTGSVGIEEAGTWKYADLPLPDCKVTNDYEIGASYCYINSTGYLVSYDTPEIVELKAQYANRFGFGGASYWDTSYDRPVGQGSLIEKFLDVSKQQFGKGLEMEQNNLHYPESQWDNLRAGMPGEN